MLKSKDMKVETDNVIKKYTQTHEKLLEIMVQ